MNMYVSNLSFHTADDDLRKLFEQFGAVSSAKVITDREMGTDDEGKEAIKGLNGKEIEGRSLSVSVAKEKPKADNKRW